MKGIQIGKEEIKLSSLRTLSPLLSNDPYENATRINEFHKIKVQKSIVFLYNNIKQLEIEMKKQFHLQ